MVGVAGGRKTAEPKDEELAATMFGSPKLFTGYPVGFGGEPERSGFGVSGVIGVNGVIGVIGVIGVTGVIGGIFPSGKRMK